MEQADVERPQSRGEEQDGGEAGVTKGARGGRVDAAFQYWRQPATLPKRRDVSRLVSGTLMPPAGSQNARECVPRDKSASHKYLRVAPIVFLLCWTNAHDRDCLDVRFRVAFASTAMPSLEMEE